MKRSLIAVGCLALIVAGACEKKENAPPATAATDTAATRGWRMEADLRIPTASSAADTALVSDVEPSQDTTLYALLPGQRRIIVYDKFGKTRREFGNEKLIAPAALGSVQGQVWVWEPSLNKLTRFKSDGGIIRADQLFRKSSARKNGMRLEAVMNDSVLLVQTAPSGGDAGKVSRAAILLTRYDGSVLDTVAVLRGQPSAERPFVAFSPGDGFVVIAQADTAPDHKTPVLRLTKVNLVGDTLFSRDLPYTPKQNLPTITGLLVATDGTILVRREDAKDEVMWSVLRRVDAKEIAQLRAPANIRALGAGGRYFFASSYGVAGNPELVRYRLLDN